MQALPIFLNKSEENTICIPSRTTKGKAPTQWMLLASLFKSSKATNEPYEPKSYKEATKDAVQDKWKIAMKEEFQFLIDNIPW